MSHSSRLFTIQLGVVKVTFFDINCIVIIIDFLTTARRAVDASIYLDQAHSLAIV